MITNHTRHRQEREARATIRESRRLLEVWQTAAGWRERTPPEIGPPETWEEFCKRTGRTV